MQPCLLLRQLTCHRMPSAEACTQLAMDHPRIVIRPAAPLPAGTQTIVNEQVRDVVIQKQAETAVQRAEVQRNTVGRILLQVQNEGLFNDEPRRAGREPLPDVAIHDVKKEPLLHQSTPTWNKQSAVR